MNLKTNNKKKNKMQFSQKICLFAMILVCVTLAGNFVLAWFDKQTLSDVAITVIGTFGGFVTTGYFALSGARDCSVNKLKASLNNIDDISPDCIDINKYQD